MTEPPETLGPETEPGTGHGAQGSGATLPANSRGTVVPAKPGQRVGRFVVERRLGAGAMGVVLLAHDPDLGRPVAIKLLRSDGEDARARLRREAQAVAKLQHPNVIAVHEVGTHGDQVYVVMEYVDGGTLRDWVKAQRRSWSEILAVYRQAGQGLIAAHQAGLVHRDFKPDNVLIGRDGRVRVTDFGIVGVSGNPAETTVPEANTPLEDASSRLTQTGAIIGTPAYMPPEQYGAGVDARSDQFAFCVSLYEALFGARPHAGDTVGALLHAVQSGKVRAVPSTDVPGPILAAVLQGLRPDPAQRHPSMQALLQRLEPKASSPVWPFAVAGVGVLALGGAAAAFVFTQRDVGDAPEVPVSAPEETPAFECPDAQAQFAAVWNDERRAEIRAAFEKHGAFQASLFERVEKALDARAAAWIWALDSACAARRAAEIDPETHALQEACLEDAREATLMLVELLARGEREIVDGAVSSVTMLPRIEPCSDVDRLEARPRPTASQREAWRTVRRELITARALMLAGKHHEMVELVTSLEQDAREVGDDATLAAVLETLARGEMQLGKLQEAEDHAREATKLAADAGDADVRARAFGTLIFVVATGQRRASEALGMLQAGRDAVAQCDDPRARSYFKAAESVVLMQNGDLDGAKAATDETIQILEAVEPSPAEELANAYSNRAGLALARGDQEGARGDQQRALEIAEHGLGTHHALYGAISLALGGSLLNVGRYEDALKRHRAALEAWEASLGPEHPSCATALTQIGSAQLMLGRRDDAAESLGEALRRLDASGQDDPNIRLPLIQQLAQLAFYRGDFDEAESHYVTAAALIRAARGPNDANAALLDQAAAAMKQARGDDEGAYKGYRDAKAALVEVYGPKHQMVAMAGAFVGDALRRLDRCDEAAREYTETFRIYSDLSLPADVTLAQAVAGQGVCELAQGKDDAAQATLARAADLIVQLGLEGEPAAAVQVAVAKGHLAVGDRETADRLSATAEATYVELGPGWQVPLDEVRTWRAEAGFEQP